MSLLKILRAVRAYSTKFVDLCPPPAYDTGCTHCALPTFPPDKQIDYTTNLNGTTATMWKHVLSLLHGMTDFNTMPSKINLAPGSLSNEFESLKRSMLSPTHPAALSYALVSGLNEPSGDIQKVFLYPDGKNVNFHIKHLPQFIEHYLLPETLQEVYNPFAAASASASKSRNGKLSAGRVRKLHPGLFEESPLEKDLVVICGHTQRDIRCGALAPLLLKEFHAVLHHEGLHDTVDVGLISHIGGHAYAGNVIFFPKDCSDLQPVWYGRVFPERVQGIVRETVMGRRIIRDLYRGQVN